MTVGRLAVCDLILAVERGLDPDAAVAGSL